MDDLIWIDCCSCGENVLYESSELDPVIPSGFLCDECFSIANECEDGQ